MSKRKGSIIFIVSAAVLSILMIIYLLVSKDICGRQDDRTNIPTDDSGKDSSSQDTGTGKNDSDSSDSSEDDSSEDDSGGEATRNDETGTNEIIESGVEVTFENAIVLRKSTNVYSEPDVSSQSLVKLVVNTTIRSYESVNDEWYRVEYNGVSGYARKEYCSESKSYYIPQGIDRAEPIDKVIRELDPSKPMVAFTFDDGPGKFTDTLLDALERNKQRANFFIIGKNVEGWEETLKRAYSLGCMIGNHTYNHMQLTKISDEDMMWQVNACDQLIKKLIPQEKIPLRPPYGSYNDHIRSMIHTPFINWSVDTLDWKLLNAEKVYKAVMSSVGDGEIILMHDVHETSVQAAVRLIDDLTAQGWQLVTIYELAYYKGITLEDGDIYNRNFNTLKK